MAESEGTLRVEVQVRVDERVESAPVLMPEEPGEVRRTVEQLLTELGLTRRG
jgi:hypothetical protein